MRRTRPHLFEAAYRESVGLIISELENLESPPSDDDNSEIATALNALEILSRRVSEGRCLSPGALSAIAQAAKDVQGYNKACSAGKVDGKYTAGGVDKLTKIPFGDEGSRWM